MVINIGFLILGLVLLIKGADWLVGGASAIAKKKNVSDLAIGLTIVAFGTSAPELVVNVVASVKDHQDIVFGNVIGSNNFNLLMILGIAGLITPLVVQRSTVYKEIPISLLAAILLFVLANSFFTDQQILSRIDGIVLLIFFCLFLFYVYKQLKREPDKTEATEIQTSQGKNWILLTIGLAYLVVGGRLVVTAAVDVATEMGVSEKLIGLTIVAAGTSLPELATTVVAAVKRNCDIAVGNIIGSNIFNVFFILGVSSVVRPIEFDEVFNIDLYLLFGGTIFLFIVMFTSGKKILDLWEAAILLFAYIAYTTWLITKEL
ncbi:calcium/sodium antiporter [Antarcticibacterium sp. 1MA-6-2]|uniref:calcium/sodium antiporter n=1 Tax=Antarcticibacterium sp. 1MA-6-2 TaxID=2908210 RepID=UPI001F37D69C|nr:calcium/sodium antiporter [Antarcticibacterium sp. 1MA-6-2]UJH92181.1 calcium/sodium antiporter [Antarcticibacterium sp. 1MA-6-2]